MRIAIVTGANKGIGLETCRALAKSGQFKTVYLTSRNVELGQAAIKGTFMISRIFVTDWFFSDNILCKRSALGFFCGKIQSDKVGCVFPKVVVSILPNVEFGPNDHLEDAPHFIWLQTFILITIKELEKDLQPNILKYHQLDIADQNSISVFSQFIQSEHQGLDSI